MKLNLLKNYIRGENSSACGVNFPDERLRHFWRVIIRNVAVRGVVWIFLSLINSSELIAVEFHGSPRSLIYSDGVDGDYKSVVYKTDSGNVLRIFDDGLSFNYDSRYDSGSISPDKAYSVVHFSEEGEGPDGPSNIYFCAFVRMSDGCVVDVVVGEKCGGGWDLSSQWSSPLGTSDNGIVKNAQTVDKIYKDYSSGRKDLFQVSSPKILSYFLEGTTLDNLLACDPPRNENKKAYIDMLSLLKRDGDISNFSRLKEVMRASGILPIGEASPGAR